MNNFVTWVSPTHLLFCWASHAHAPVFFPKCRRRRDQRDHCSREEEAPVSLHDQAEWFSRSAPCLIWHGKEEKLITNTEFHGISLQAFLGFSGLHFQAKRGMGSEFWGVAWPQLCVTWCFPNTLGMHSELWPRYGKRKAFHAHPVPVPAQTHRGRPRPFSSQVVT